MTQLTRRQKDFLNRFLGLYKKTEKGLHYSAVARTFGLGKVSAYEMLRLLESRGFVRSEFQARSPNSGPGRSRIIFYPTSRAVEILKKIQSNFHERIDWKQTKAKILSRLSDTMTMDYDKFLQDLFDRIPERRSPGVFLTEIITAAILTAATFQGAARNNLIEQFRKIGLPNQISLNTLPGICISFSLLDQFNRNASTFFVSQHQRFQSYLDRIDEETSTMMSSFAREIAALLT